MLPTLFCVVGRWICGRKPDYYLFLEALFPMLLPVYTFINSSIRKVLSQTFDASVNFDAQVAIMCKLQPSQNE